MTEIYKGLHVTWMINLWHLEYVQSAKANLIQTINLQPM